MQETHVDRGVRNLLARPLVYNTFQTVIGANRARARYFKEFIQVFSGARVLDIGCGTGILLDHLPSDVEYTGVDMNSACIEFAREKFGDRGKFLCERVGDQAGDGWTDYFDVINAHGLLHHLSDDDSEQLFSCATRFLKPGGYMVTADPVFTDGQSRVARWVISKDRGQNVRTPDAYLALAHKFFEDVTHCIRSKESLLPYTGIRMVCRKSVDSSSETS